MKNIKNLEVIFKKQTLIIDGVYIQNHSEIDRDNPPQKEDFEIDKIQYKNTDITDLFYELVLDDSELISVILQTI